MKKPLIWGSVLTLIFGLALATSYLCLRHFAAGRPNLPQGVAAAHAWAHEMGLSREQEKQLAPMEASLKKDLQGLQIRLAQERMALCGLMQGASGNSQELDVYVSRIGALEAEQQRRVVQHLLAMRDILTPQQRDQFFAAIMQGICEGCRSATHTSKCICGMCNLKRS